MNLYKFQLYKNFNLIKPKTLHDNLKFWIKMIFLYLN